MRTVLVALVVAFAAVEAVADPHDASHVVTLGDAEDEQAEVGRGRGKRTRRIRARGKFVMRGSRGAAGGAGREYEDYMEDNEYGLAMAMRRSDLLGEDAALVASLPVHDAKQVSSSAYLTVCRLCYHVRL